MKSLRWGVVVCAVAVLVGGLTSACSRHYVVVPQPEDGYAPTDTLYGRLYGDEIRVTFWFDTVMRVDTLVRLDTLWEEGSRTILRVDTLTATDTILRVDTVRVSTTETVVRADTILRVDTVRVSTTETVVDTLVRVDTVRVAVTDTVVLTNTVLRTDTLRVAVTDTLVRVDTVLRTDTLRMAVTDTVLRTDTIVVTVTDTVHVAGQRLLFVPPGHYPPEGQCRVWIHDLPPGRQAAAAPCSGLGGIPAGAFILFGGDAWDFDYDWLAVAASDPGAVPPEIVALKRKG